MYLFICLLYVLQVLAFVLIYDLFEYLRIQNKISECKKTKVDSIVIQSINFFKLAESVV